MAVNQAELRAMAEERIKDAKALIDGGRLDFAYYVAGYAIECALKSCVLAQMVHTGWIFDEQVKRIDDCRVHEFMALIRIAGLKDELDVRLRESAGSKDGFIENWDTVNEWKVTSRYVLGQSNNAQKLYDAIVNEPSGVLRWIRNHW